MTDFDKYIKQFLKEQPFWKRLWFRIWAFISLLPGHFFWKEKQYNKLIDKLSLPQKLLFSNHLRKKNGEE